MRKSRFNSWILVAGLALGFTASANADLTRCLPLGEKAPQQYRVEPMAEKWVRIDVDKGTRYFYSEAERAPYKMKTNQGQFESDGDFKGLYVMDAFGDFYLMKDEPKARHGEKIQHSTFFAGREVASAGMIWIQGGRVNSIDTASGHYKTTPDQLAGALDSLYRKGFDLTDTRIIKYGGNKKYPSLSSPTPALPFLFQSYASKLCIEKYLLESSVLTPHDFADYRAAVADDHFYRFISRTGRQGKLARFQTALGPQLESDSSFRLYFEQAIAPSGLLTGLSVWCKRWLNPVSR